MNYPKFNPCPKEGMPPKKAKKALKRSPIKKKFKKTGESIIFEEIAAERDWKCFVTGSKLPHLSATSFMHILPKALNRYPKMKLYKPNIVLVRDDIHYAYDFMPKSTLVEPYWDKVWELQAELLNEYRKL